MRTALMAALLLTLVGCNRELPAQKVQVKQVDPAAVEAAKQEAADIANRTWEVTMFRPSLIDKDMAGRMDITLVKGVGDQYMEKKLGFINLFSHSNYELYLKAYDQQSEVIRFRYNPAGFMRDSEADPQNPLFYLEPVLN